MKYGVCVGNDLATAREVLDAGFDYVEMGAVGFKAWEDDEPDLSGFQEFKPPCTNLFIPWEMKLIGPEAIDAKAYGKRLFARAEKVGVKLMVVGSGGARKAPPGWSVSEAEEAFVELVAALQEIATDHGIRLAPESLKQEETNVGNDLGRLARMLDRAGCDVTADSHHVLVEWAKVQTGEAAPSADHMAHEIPFAPAHVHLGDLPRLWPRSGDPQVKRFAERLKAVEYDGTVSLEAGRVGFEGEWQVIRSEMEKLFSA